MEQKEKKNMFLDFAELWSLTLNLLITLLIAASAQVTKQMGLLWL